MAVNSAGNLVGAIFESLGYHYQAVILDSLTTPFREEVGGLVYLFGIALAILMTATQGNYKMGVWLLIGPPLFFAAIVPRENINNASWKFGRQARNDNIVAEEKNEALEHAGQKQSATANVSKLFSAFVKLVSVSQQEIVHIMTSNRNEADLALIVRAELFSQIHIGQFNKPGLERLFHRGLVKECGDALEYARAMNDPLYLPAKFGNIRKQVNDADRAGQEGQKIFKSRKEHFKKKFEEEASQKQNLDNLEAELIAATLVKNGNDEFHKKVEDLVGKQTYNCHDIWRILIYFIEEQARQDLDRILKNGEKLGVSQDTLVNLIKQAHGIQVQKAISADGKEIVQITENDMLAIRKIFAKYMLRNEFRKNSWGSWLAYWMTGLETQDIRMRYSGKESFTEQARTAAQEWSEKERMVNAAGTIPYYQGLALYVLGATYPFFALLLLIPGKQAGFFMWFMLWIWVKSWDVAMAVVMILDDVIFAMLSVQKQGIGIVQGENELQSFDLAMASINEMDPTFQLSTYYSIMATIIVAIPSTTAYILLGGLKGGAGLITQGVNRNSMNATGMFIGAVEQNAVNALKNDFNERKESLMQQYSQNVEKGLAPHHNVKNDVGQHFNPQGNNPVKSAAFTNSAFSGSYTNLPSRGNVSPAEANALRASQQLQRKEGQYAISPAGTGQELATRRQQNFDDAARAGTGTGTNKPARGFQEIKNPKIQDILSRTTTSSDRHYGGLYTANVAKANAEFSSITAQAIWDGEVDPLQLYRVNLMSTMGALSIPSPNFALAYAGAEGQRDFLFAQFKEDQGRKIADWNFRGDIAFGIRESISTFISSVSDPKRAEQEGISLAAISPEARKALIADFNKLTEDGKKALGPLTNSQIRSLSAPTREILLKSKNFATFTAGVLGLGSEAGGQVKRVVTGTGANASDWITKKASEIYGSAYGNPEDMNDLSPQTWGPQGDKRRRRGGIGGGSAGGGGTPGS